MWHELRYALRQFRNDKLLSAVVVLLLGVGIGANAVIFGFVNAVILRPLPVRHPQNLFLIEKMRQKQVLPEMSCFYRTYEQIRSRSDLFSSAVAAQEWTEASFQPLEEGNAVRMVSTEVVSPNYFSELGVTAILGRPLAVNDANASSDIPAVISYHFWATQMNQDSHVIGRTLRVKHFPFRIIGVLPSTFHGMDIDRSPDVRLPLAAAPVLSGHSVFDVSSLGFQVLVRLRPGRSSSVSAEALARTMQDADASLIRATFAQESDNNKANAQPTPARPQVDQMIQFATSYRVRLSEVSKGVSRTREQFATALYVLITASGLLFLALCASVTGLLLARTERRRRELAIRLAIGARRTRVLRQIVTDIFVLTLPSTLFAVVIAQLLGPFLLRLIPKVRGLLPIYPTEQVIDLSWDGRTLLFVLALCLLAVSLSSLGPLWRAARIDISANLKRDPESAAHTPIGMAVLAMQLALCVVLLSGAMLLFRTFWNLQHLNPGFDRAHIIEIDLNPSGVGYASQQVHQVISQLCTDLHLLPGVRSVGAALMGVMHGVGIKSTIAPEGVTLPEKTFANTNIEIVTPEYFSTLGIPLLAGRFLDDRDRNVRPQPVVINKAFADLFFPQVNPLGRRLVAGTNGKMRPTQSIVGVVGTAKYRSLREEAPPIAYGVDSDRYPARIIYLRTLNNPQAMLGMMEKVIATRYPRIPIISASTLEQEVNNSLWQERLLAILCGAFSLMAVGLAGAGVYAALAYSVASQTRAIGIRIALGAQPSDLVRSICSALVIAMFTGVGLGFIAAMFLTRLTKSLLFGVQGIDPLTYSLTVFCILLLASLAALVPVLRAIKTNPALIMRTE